jgi:putative peptidoglycan lipid II flippase
LYYSDRLAELPLGVFGIAIATVILPNLSAHRAAAREDHFSAILDWAMRLVLLVGFPSAVALMLLAEPILITLFQHGALTPEDVGMSALSLQAYSVGLVAFMLIKVLAPGFYARKNIATPVKYGIVAMAANMVMNVLFVLPLMLWNIGHVGLALATSLAAVLNAALLLRGLLRAGFYRFQPGWGVFLLRVVVAVAVMVTVLWWITPEVAVWSDWNWHRRILNILGLSLVGVGVYFAGLILLGTKFGQLRSPAVD